MRSIRCAVRMAVLLVALTSAAARADEPLLLGAEAAYAMPLTSPQADRFQPGGTLGIALHVPAASWITTVVRFRGVLLGDGPRPADIALRDPGMGTVLALTAGLRLRPAGWLAPEELERANGFWLEIAAGGGLTGDLVRPWFEVGVGYGFDLGDVRLGPAVRFMHLLHWDDPIDSSSAYLMSAGFEIVLFDRRTEPLIDDATAGDRDADTLIDEVDRCADEPEDRDAFSDEDGCPDPDNDRDGILDAQDACPSEAEDRDGWADEDGCPESDNDRDGLLDADDACPVDPETVNGVDDDDGCPDEGLIELVEDRVIIEDTVLFDFGLARVKHAARPVLAAVVELWRQHPEWSGVRIEGHADVRGDAELNQHLSELRAERVRAALIALGMGADAIEVVGYGAMRPRDVRQTEDAHQRNRRVEFVVVTPPRAAGSQGDGRTMGGAR